MRFQRWLMNEEDNIIQKALDIEEPEEDVLADPERIQGYINIIKGALEIVKDKLKTSPENSDDNVIVAQYKDLKDKEVKWQEVLNKITVAVQKASGQGQEPEEEEPEEEEPEEEEPEEEDI
jgi:C4-type Zn-finger protein